MTYDSLTVANTLISKMSGLTNIQLQKLLYFAHAKYLLLTDGKEGLVDEDFYAWEFGPVSKDLYHVAKGFGREPIKEPFSTFYISDIAGFSFMKKDPEFVPESDEQAIRAINETIQLFGNYRASDLVNKSHELGSPWAQVYDGNKNTTITNSSIYEYYRASGL